MRRKVGIAALGAVLLWSSHISAQGLPLRNVTFIPQWIPQAQFAGYFVALDKGFYEKQGLNIKILRGGPDHPSSRALEQGDADFATMFLSTAIQKRSRGLKVVNIAQIVQKSALMLVARKSSGIQSPEDINGKKVSVWSGDFQLQPAAFFRKYNLDVTVIPQSSTLNLFLRGGVDVASAMWYNEYHTILSSGLDPEDLTTFLLADFGINFPEDGIYCMEATWEFDPETCCRFVRASIEGWLYAFTHPGESMDIVMRYVKEAMTPTNRMHQKWMLERMKDLILPPGLNPDSVGRLRPEDYEPVVQEMSRHGAIQDPPDYAEFARDCAIHVQP